MSNVLISVIVCTYNRSNLLKLCLDSLTNQTSDKSIYEVIIVNNNSTDNTQKVAEEFINNHDNFRIVNEKNQGLSYSRNRGYKEAKGNYIAYIDDDAKASNKFIEKTIHTFENISPTPVAIGGPVYPFYNNKAEWFKDRYEIRSYGECSRFLKKGKPLSGSNMVFHRSILEKYNGFSMTLGMKGKKLSLGEETNLFNFIYTNEKGSKLIFYTQDLIVYHFVPEFKQKLIYRIKRSFIAGQVNYSINESGLFKAIGKNINLIIKKLFYALISFNKYSHYQNWVIEYIAPIFSCLGYLLKSFGITINVKNK